MAALCGFNPYRIIAAALALLLGGCAAQSPIVKKAEPLDALIRVDDPLLRDARTTRVHYLGVFDHVAYARFETDALTLEAVYVAALGDNFVLDYGYGMERMIETWNAHQGHGKRWGERSIVPVAHGAMPIQPFQTADRGPPCTAFNTEWDFRPRDGLGRPGKVLFGYICTKPGALISQARIATLLSSMSVSPRSAESLVPVQPRRDIDQAAFDAAKGADGGTTGNGEFPFDFGTIGREAGPGA